MGPISWGVGEFNESGRMVQGGGREWDWGLGKAAIWIDHGVGGIGGRSEGGSGKWGPGKAVDCEGEVGGAVGEVCFRGITGLAIHAKGAVRADGEKSALRKAGVA